MANVDMKSAEDDKLTDDDLKRHRVGGRLVTRREIARAKKCTKFILLMLKQRLIVCNVYSHESTRGLVLAA